MNYNDMPAGAEMDRLIAEKVMGWRRHEDGLWTPGDHRDGWGAMWRNGWPDWLPEYSSDIKDAWEVVERLRVAHWIDIQDMRSYYDVSIKATADAAPSCATGDTAPLAICRAALLAMEVGK